MPLRLELQAALNACAGRAEATWWSPVARQPLVAVRRPWWPRRRRWCCSRPKTRTQLQQSSLVREKSHDAECNCALRCIPIAACPLDLLHTGAAQGSVSIIRISGTDAIQVWKSYGTIRFHGQINPIEICAFAALTHPGGGPCVPSGQQVQVWVAA